MFLREIAEANDLVGILSDASSDNTAAGNKVELYGLLGDRCNDDRDCFLDYSDCHFDEILSSKRCQCRQGFIPTKNNVSCEPGSNLIQKIFVDYREYQLSILSILTYTFYDF